MSSIVWTWPASSFLLPTPGVSFFSSISCIWVELAVSGFFSSAAFTGGSTLGKMGDLCNFLGFAVITRGVNPGLLNAGWRVGVEGVEGVEVTF